MTSLGPLTFTLTALAVYRLTLLVTADELTRPWREWAIEKLGAESRWAYLIECPWCCSMYVAPPAVLSALAWSDGWGWKLAAGSLAASAVTGIAATYASPNT